MERELYNIIQTKIRMPKLFWTFWKRVRNKVGSLFCYTVQQYIAYRRNLFYLATVFSFICSYICLFACPYLISSLECGKEIIFLIFFYLLRI